jgi:copper oxidase (laccase) domain-containing protein
VVADVDVLLRRRVADRTLIVGATEQTDGDLHPGRVEADVLRRRQCGLVGSTWAMLDQHHGADVHIVGPDVPTPWPLVAAGDVLVAPAGVSVPLAVWAADCAPIVLLGADGTRVAAHAGWRGLAAGVIDAALDAVGAVDAAVLGPCIHTCCYEFAMGDLEEVAATVGLGSDEVRGQTSWGTPALDVPATVSALLARRNITLDVSGPCTGCDLRFRSHRRRGDVARHAVVTWVEQGQ